MTVADPRTKFYAQVDNDSNLTIYIGGLALLNRLKSGWEAMTLDEVECHDLRVTLATYQEGTYQTSVTLNLGSHSGLVRKVQVLASSTESKSTLYDPRTASDFDYRMLQQFHHLGIFFGNHGIHYKKPVAIKAPKHKNTRFKLPIGKAYNAMLAPGIRDTPDFYTLGSPNPRYLGKWAAIDVKCDESSPLEIIVNNEPLLFEANFNHFSNGRSFALILDNDCDGTTSPDDIDFKHYYQNHDGPITEQEIIMEHRKGMTIGRVACNMMILTEEEANPILYDLV